MKRTSFRCEREVAFSDTDASGRVHFTKILTFAEEAEHGYLHSIGIAVFDQAGGGWPRVRVSCDYGKALRFQDRVQISLGLSEIGRSSVKWDFEIATLDGGIAATGELVTVKVNASGVPAAITFRERKLLEGGL